MATNNQRLSNLETQFQEHSNNIQQLRIQLQESVTTIDQGIDVKLELLMKRFESLLAAQKESNIHHGEAATNGDCG